MTVSEAIAVWTAEGKPVVSLGAGENCFDLEKLLSRSDINERHLLVVRDWLQNNLHKRDGGQAENIENRKAVKIAREDHQCGSCGKLISKGDPFVMKMDRGKGSLRRYPTCLECYKSWLSRQ